MTKDQFKEQVEDFADNIEWADGKEVVYDFKHELEAIISVNGGGHIFSIFVCVNPEDEEEIVIDCGDDNYLPADTENAYGYLWCGASAKIKEMMGHCQC